MSIRRSLKVMLVALPLAVALLAPKPAEATSCSLNVSRYTQEQSNWCQYAIMKSITTFKGYVRTQCFLQTIVFDVPVCENIAAYNSQVNLCYQQDFWWSTSYSETGQLSWSTVWDEVYNKNLPVHSTIAWTSGGRHATAISAVDNCYGTSCQLYIRYIDPGASGGGTFWKLWSSYLSNTSFKQNGYIINIRS